MNLESVFTQADLPGFFTIEVTKNLVTQNGVLRVYGSSDGRSSVKSAIHASRQIQARRRADDAFLVASVTVYLSESKAKSFFARRRVSATPVERVKGTRSNKKIGDESYHTKGLGYIKLPQHSYSLTARKGQCLVEIRLKHPMVRDANKNLTKDQTKQGLITQQDMTFVEDLAASALNKLEKQGYTKDL